MMPAYKLVKSGDLLFLTFPIFTDTNLVVHGFSTRWGGVSPEPYDSLNLGLHVGDRPEYVLENRARISRALGIDPGHLVSGAQVHGSRVKVIRGEHLGRGAKSQKDTLPGVDALVTDRPGVPLASYYADCVPVFLMDPVRKVVALAHAGWKGTVLHIARKTVEKMASTFNCDPGDCLAVIGPSIGQCCYEVDVKVVDKLQSGFDNWQQFVEPLGKGRWKLNLAAVNRDELLNSGLRPQNVMTVDLCTACHNHLFFSHRFSGGKTGRMGAIIMLK